MSRVISTCLLALAVLQGVIPADNCVLKLAGLCRCGSHVAAIKSGDCCDENESTAASEPQSCCHAEASDSTCKHAPMNGNHQKPCCAYTPAEGLTTDAPSAPLADTFHDCVPTAFVTILSSIFESDAHFALSPQGLNSPQPYDTPLYLRVHTFLI